MAPREIPVQTTEGIPYEEIDFSQNVIKHVRSQSSVTRMSTKWCFRACWNLSLQSGRRLLGARIPWLGRRSSFLQKLATKAIVAGLRGARRLDEDHHPSGSQAEWVSLSSSRALSDVFWLRAPARGTTPRLGASARDRGYPGAGYLQQQCLHHRHDESALTAGTGPSR